MPIGTAARNTVTQLAKSKENRIYETLQDKQIFVVIEETEINIQMFNNSLVGNVSVLAVTPLAESFAEECKQHNYYSTCNC